MLWSATDRALSALDWPSADARVLVACSGGLDSVVLVDVVAQRLGPGRVVVGHVNHGVRSDAAIDEAFVAELARCAGLELSVRRLRPSARDEATLRRLRYAALESMRDAAGAAFVFLGHHRDDQAETVLMRLIRRGRLRGMASVRGTLVRPFLPVPRAHLLAHARRRRLRWREDPSNQDPGYLRNRVRRELMPLLETRYRAGIARRLVALAEDPAAPGLDQAVPTGRPVLRLDLSGIAARVPRIGWRRVEHQGEPVPEAPDRAWFDADDVPDLQMRPARAGDRIRPWGMKGRKKVFDVFQEHRVPRDLRGFVPLVLSGEEVLWVPGIVRSARAAIRPETRARWELWCKWE